jgi:hypothetical protein
MMVDVYNHSTQKAGEGESQVQGHLDYIARHCVLIIIIIIIKIQISSMLI